MELDLRTLFFTLTVVELVLAAVLLLFWRTQTAVPGIPQITIASVLGVLASVLTALRGTVVPVGLSILGGNLGFVAAILLGLRAFQAARGKHGRPVFETAMMVLTALGLGYFTIAEFNTAARIIIGNGLLAVIGFVGAYDLSRENRAEFKVVYSFVATLFLIYAVALVVNVFATILVGADPVFLETRATVTAVTMLVSIGAAIGWTLGFLWIAYDIAQARLRNAEKLDAVGRLAGGIAHELNNTLAPISGLTSTVLEEMGKDDRARRRLELVLRASNRAADLVRGILTFGQRQDAMVPEKIDMAAALRDSLADLRPDLPDGVSLTEAIDDGTGSVVADAEYIRIVLENLVSNAVDAMEGAPGRLEVSLAAVTITIKTDADILGLASGAYAKLKVADNGHGMNESTLNQAVDPFFTTKKVGSGVGLGLSVVNGIAAMAGGALHLSSTPGLGTTAEVYLPLAGD